MSKLCLCDGPPCRVVGKNTVSLCRVNSYSPLKDCRTWCSRSKSSSCSRDGLRFFVRSELTGLAFSAPFSSLARPLDALFLDVRLPTRPLVVLHVHSQRSGKSAEDKNDASSFWSRSGDCARSSSPSISAELKSLREHSKPSESSGESAVRLRKRERRRASSSAASLHASFLHCMAKSSPGSSVACGGPEEA